MNLRSLLTFGIMFFAFIPNSCTKTEVNDPYPKDCVIPVLNKGDIIVDIKKNNDVYILHLKRDSSISIPEECISYYNISSEKWQLEINYVDGRSINLPYLGEFPEFNPKVTLNPSGYAPLSALLEFTTPIPCKISISVAVKDVKSAKIIHRFDDLMTEHQIPIYGLYSDFLNTIHVNILDKSGNSLSQEEINIRTEAYERVQSGEMTVLNNNYTGDQKNRLFLIQNAIYDAAGEVRWYTTHYGNKFYKLDSNLIAIQVHPDRGKPAEAPYIKIIDLLGNVHNTYDVPSRVHHEIIEKTPGGNLLVATNAQEYNGMEDDTEDMIAEIERNSGDIVKKWNLRQIFDPARERLWIEQENDWCHLNSIQYISSDNSLLISSKLQYFIAKIDYETGDIQWMLGNHENWDTPWQEYLLSPLNFDNTEHPGMDWPYAQHMPRMTEEGTILVYDNGGNRPGGEFSRAVEYRVCETDMKVKKEWSYRLENYASALGSIHRYEDNTTQIGHGNKGKILEVTSDKDILFAANLKSFYRAYPIKFYH